MYVLPRLNREGLLDGQTALVYLSATQLKNQAAYRSCLGAKRGSIILCFGPSHYFPQTSLKVYKSSSYSYVESDNNSNDTKLSSNVAKVHVIQKSSKIFFTQFCDFIG